MSARAQERRTFRANTGRLVATSLLVLIAVTVVGLLHPTATNAATSDTVNFQAKLMTNTGGIAPDGYYNVQFKLYSASTGGSALWTETWYDSNGATAGNDNRVRVANGYLTVNLGAQNGFPSNLNWAQNMYITMNVGGSTQTATPTWDGEMTPRLKLTAVPYAFSAGNLSNFNATSGFTSTLSFQGATGQDQTIQIPDNPTNASDQVCLLTLQNCFGGAGGGIAGAGTQNFVAKFDNASGFHIGSSSIYDDGNFVGINNSLSNDGLLSVHGLGATQSSIFVQGTGSASVATAVIKQGASQTGNLIELQDSSGNVNASFNNTGNILTLGRVAGSGTVTQGQLKLADGTTDGFTLTVKGATLTSDSTVTIPNAGGNDTVCLLTLSNCTGTGGGIAGSGTQNYIAKFDTVGGNHIGNASLFDNGSFVGLNTTTNNGLLSIQGSGAAQSSLFVQAAASASAPTIAIKQATSQGGDLLQLVDTTGNPLGGFAANGSLYYANSGFTTTLSTATLTADQLISLPNETGTLCLQGSSACGFELTGGNDFIQNQTATNQTAGFKINGNGTLAILTANTSVLTSLIDAPTAGGTVAIGTTNATGGINLNQNTTIAANKSINFATGNGNFDMHLSSGTFQTGTGNITLNGSTTLAAGKGFTITGGGTGTRPLIPTAGTLYYDTTTNQLLVYNGTKWQADRARDTKIVAPSTASQAVKDSADYVGNGSTDETVINAALTAAAGGTVYLLPGTYTTTGTILIPNNTTLEGAGSNNTTIQLNVGGGNDNLIENSDTTTGTDVSIRNLTLSNSAATGGTQHAIYLDGLNGGSGNKVHLTGLYSNGWTHGSNIVFNNSYIFDFSSNFTDSIVLENASGAETFKGNTMDSIALDNSSITTYIGNNSGNATLTNNAFIGTFSGDALVQLSLDNSNISNFTGNTTSGAGVSITNGSSILAFTGNYTGSVSVDDSTIKAFTGNRILGTVTATTGAMISTFDSNESGSVSFDDSHTNTFTGNNSSGSITFDNGSDAQTFTGNTLAAFTVSNGSYVGDASSNNTLTVTIASGSSVDSFVGNATGNIILNATGSGSTISNNTICTGSSTDAIFLVNSSDNLITGNRIKCGSTGYAINISDALSSSNYLADNTLGGLTIHDLGTGTIYGGQVNASGDFVIQPAGNIDLNNNTVVAANKSFTANGTALFKDATNSTTAFEIQNSTGTSLFTADTVNQAITVNGQSILGGAADQTQVIVKASASQSASNPLIMLQSSTGSELARINADANDNFFAGNQSGGLITTASGNTGVGSYTLQGNTTGNYNTALGAYALTSNTTGSANAAIGVSALESNTTGRANVAIGNESLTDNISGDYNVAVGDSSLRNNTSGRRNLAIGDSALQGNTTGDDNIGIGSSSLLGSTGYENIAIGTQSSSSTSTGHDNTAIGTYSLGYNSTGSYNVAIGYNAGTQDAHVFRTVDTIQNSTAIGAYAQVQQSNTIVLGSVDNVTQVVVGATVPVGGNIFGVSPVDVNPGTSVTASQTNGSGAITSTGPIFTATNVGEMLVWDDGTTETITAYTDASNVTGSLTNITKTNKFFRIHHTGFQVTNNGDAYIRNGSTTAFQVQGATGTSLFTVDTTNSAISLNAAVTASTGITLTNGGSLVTQKGTDFATTGTSNNVNFGAASLYRLTGASAQTITGIAGGVDGRILTLVNAAAQAATISNNSGSSTATNRIIIGTGVDMTLPAGGSITLIYDSGANVWRVNGSAAGSGGVSTVGPISSTANANGATVTGSVLNLTAADSTNGGVLTAGAQTIGGAKTFAALITGNAGITTTGGAVSLQGNAASSLTTTVGNLTLDAAATLQLGASTATGVAIGHSGITTTITGGLTQTTGVFSLTGNGASQLSTTSGALTLDAAAALNLANTNATSVAIGHSGITTTITGGLTQTTGAISLTGNATSQISTTTGNFTLDAAANVNIGTTNATNVTIGRTSQTITLNGDTTSNGNIIVAAGKSITIVGGITSSRPASPSEGMLYYDSTTKQLLVYANGKWQADRRTATKIVAPSSASQDIKDSADYVGNGTSDQTAINAALAAAAGGTVYLLPGAYVTTGTILIPDNTTLEGAGSGTVIQLNVGSGNDNLIENSNTTNGVGVVIRNLTLDGSLGTGGTQNAIYISGFSGYDESYISKVYAQSWNNGDSIVLDAANFEKISGNYLRTVSIVNGSYLADFSDNDLYQLTVDNADIVTYTNNYQSGITIDNGGKIANLTGSNIGAITLSNSSSIDTLTGNGMRDLTLDDSNITTVTGNVMFGFGDLSLDHGSEIQNFSSNYLRNVTLANGSDIINFAGNVTGSISASGAGIYTMTDNTVGSISITTNQFLDAITNNVISGSLSVSGQLGVSPAVKISGNKVVAISLTSVNDSSVSGNMITGGTTGISITSSDNNQVIDNVISSQSSTHAINITDAASDNTYLATNNLNGLDIVNSGTGTVYGGQLSGSGVYTVQNAGGIQLTGSTTVTGNLTQSSGVITLQGNAASSITTTSGNLTLDSAATLELGNTNATAVSLGRTAAAVTITGNSSSTFVINGITVDATEFNRLDGKDAALVDTNDAVATAITGTGTLTTGSINWSGNIATSGNISTSGTGTITSAGVITANGGVTITNGGSLAIQKGSDFATTGTSNDVNLGTASLVRLTGASAQTITGIAGGVDGRVLTIVNAAGQAATIANGSTGSAAANRILTGTGADISLPADATVTLIYDSGASRWRVTSGVAATGGVGVNTVGAISGTSNANGATITGTTLNLTAADGTNGGVLTAGAQTIGGAKTFAALITGNAGITTTGGAVSLQGNAASSITTTVGNLTLDAAATLQLGASTATGVAIGHSGVTTTITGGLTQQTGVFSLTGNGASQISTTSGALTLDAAAALNLANTNATSVAIGHAGITTTITGGLTQTTGAISLTGNATSQISTTTGNFTLDAAATVNIGTTNATNVTVGRTGQTITLNGDTTSNGNIVVAAGKYVTITGSGTRPASPTEGMVYFDTSTHQLLQYNGTKWMSDRSVSTKIVAASDSSQAVKDAADYVATGTNDETIINSALTAAAGGRVYLTEGNYTLGASVVIKNSTTLMGAGKGTVLKLANGINADVSAITNFDISTGTGVSISNLKLDGNKTNNTAGNQYGVYLDHMTGASVTNIEASNFRNVGVLLGSSTYDTVSGIIANNNSSSGIATSSGSNIIITNNITNTNGSYGIWLFLSNTNVVTGNTTDGNTTLGIFAQGGAGGNITGNNTASNGSYGIMLNNAVDYTVTGNAVSSNPLVGILLFNLSANNTIVGNNVYNNGGATTNNGIYLDASDSNTISGNVITDTSAITNNYAINVVNSTSDTNYITDNTLGGGSINNAGTGTIFAGQLSGGNIYTIQGASGIQLTGSTTVTGSLTQTGGAISLQGNAASSITTTTGNLTLDAAAALQLGNTNATSIALGHSGITTTITGGLTQNTGVFSLTGNGASQLSTTSGALTLDAAAALNLGQTNSTAIAIGHSGITTTITGGLTQTTGAVSLTGNATSQISTTTGNFTLDAAATVNIGTTNATNVTIGRSGQTITLSGATTASAGISITNGGSLATQKGTDFATTGSSNDVNFGAASLYRLTGASAQTITGIAGGVDGRVLTLVNAASNVATLADNNSGSAAANRIISGTGADISLPAGASITLIYDSTASLWRVTGSTAATGGSGVNTVGVVSNTPTANGATITGTTLNLAVADASNAGLIGTGAQSFAGLKTFQGGIISGNINTTAGQATSLGNTTGALTITGNSSSTFVINGTTVDATEFNRLDGKDAALVDTNDAVATAITGTGTLTTGAINWSGAITTSGNISTTGTGTITAAGLITANGGLTAANINTTAGQGTTLGNSTGTLAVTGNSSSTFVINGSTVDATEFTRLDGKDAALVDTNDAVATAITGTGTLTTGAINWSGAVTTSGNISTTGTGTITSAGLLTASGGLTAANINTTAGQGTSIGNSTGTLTVTGNSSSTFVINGITIDATEFNRLDGKDAALVDTNDAVATAITGTGALTTGSINWSGNIATSGNISTSGTGTITSAGIITANGGIDVANTGSLATKAGSTFTTAGTSNNAALNVASLYLLDTSGAAQVINGITAGRDGQRLTLTNVDASLAVTLSDNSGSATGAKIITGTGADVTLPVGSSAELIYDSANTVWRIVGGVAASGGVGVNTIGTYSSSNHYANGANITGTTLTLGSADASNPGLVDTSGQTFAGLKTFQGGITSANINTTAGQATSLGNSTGALTVTGNSSSTFVINGATVDATEFTRLDGKDAALVDTNDAVNTAITGTGTLTTGAINWAGNISTSGNISTTGTGTITSAGLITANGGLTAANINTTAAQATNLGNSTGNITYTGNSSSTFVINGITVDATEFNRLDGKDAALVDTNDAVATAITGTGTLTTGAINWSGNIQTSGNVSTTGTGTITSAGLLTANGGLTAANINNTAGQATSLGNSTGAVTITGNSSSTFVINGTTVDATEFNRLDGKDAALVDVNDAVNTAITGTGALTSGSINWSGNIATSGNISTSGSGTITAAGLITANGGLTAANINNTAGQATSLGNTTGALTVTGNSSSTFVINGATVDATEFNRLDGKDAALVDTNDAVATAITGTGALTTGSINWSGNITTSGNIATTGSGTITSNGLITANGGLTVSNGGSFATERGGDYSTTGVSNDAALDSASLVRLTGASAQTLTGIVGGYDGRVLTLVNAGTTTAVLRDNNTGSTAANRITTGTGGDVNLPAGASISLIYDSAVSRWRIIGSTAATGGAGVNTIGAISGTSNANGATITGTTLNLTAADGTNGGVVTNVGQTFAGLKTFQAGITSGSINTTAGQATSLGNSTGALTVTGNSSSTFVINGATVDATEFNRLDGKDAALVDTNDAVATAITGTGALTTGSINWSGNIATSGNISTSGTGTITSAGLITANAGIASTGGAVTLTGNAGSSLTTTSGALTLQGAGVVNLTTTNAATSSNISIKSGNSSVGAAGTVTIDTGTSASGTSNLNIGATNAGNIALGNSTGTLTVTGSSSTTFVINGATVDATEFNRLDGKDAALVDMNDAVATAITGTGALTTGSINWSGNIATSGNISTSGTGTITSAGLLTANGGLTAANINTTAAQATSLGNSTGAFTVTGNSSSTFVINGTTVDATEFNRLDGKDAALVDTNDAVATAITGTGALTTGSINWSGNIQTSGNISTTGSGTITSAGIITANGGITVANTGSLSTTSGSTFTTPGTNTNAALNTASFYKLDTSGAAQVLQGITAGRDGQYLTLTNVNATNAVTLANNNAGATGSKIITGTGGDITMPAGASVNMIYDLTNSIWRVVGSTGAGGAGVNAVGTYSDSNHYANGASISGTTITLGAADGSTPGLLSNNAQTIGGAKTFSALITGNAGISTTGGAVSLQGNAASQLTTSSGNLLLDAAGNLNLGTTNATAINIGKTTSNVQTTINGTVLVKPTTGNDSTVAFQVQNAAGSTNVFTVNTATAGVSILGNLTQSTGAISLTGNAASSISTTTGNFALDAAATVNIGVTNATNVTIGRTGQTITLNGDTTSNGNIVVAADKYVTITGSGTRPSSPTEGMLYYDTTTKQLLTYANGKWKADSTEAVLVAANDSSAAAKAAADFIATGTGDQATISNALTAATTTTTNNLGSRKVYLFAGTYTVNGSISVPNNTTLVGAGTGTLITIPNALGGTVSLIVNSDATTGTGITIRDLRLDGNRTNISSGSKNGIVFTNVGDTTSPRPGATIQNVWANNFNNAAVSLLTSDNSVVSGVIAYNNEYGVDVENSYNDSVVGNSTSGGRHGIFMYGGSDNAVTGNATTGASNEGIMVNAAPRVTVSGNSASGNTSFGIYVYNVSNAIVSGNTVSQNGVSGVRVEYADDNAITNNRLVDNGGATTNEAIYLFTSNNNQISGNKITDASATTNNYAIDIDSALTGTYISDNMLGGGSIRDTGSGTVYGGQLSGSNVYNIQESSGIQLTGPTTITGSLTQSGGAVSLTGNAASSFTTTAGGITIDTTTAAGQTIAIGNGAITHTIQIGTGAAAQTVSIGSTNGGSSLALNAGTGGLTIQTQGTGVLGIGNNAVAQTIQIGNITGATSLALQAGSGGVNVTGALTANNNVTVGASAGSGTVFTNNGATVNATLAITSATGVFGANSATVDLYTAFAVNSTAAGQSFTIPTPTANTTYGRVIYVSNIGATNSFTFTNTYLTAALNPGATATLLYANVNGTGAWTYAGSDGGAVLNQNSTDQTANFRISGTGRANTSFITPLVDAIGAGTLGVGTATTGNLTVGNSTAGGANSTTVQAAVGGITLQTAVTSGGGNSGGISLATGAANSGSNNTSGSISISTGNATGGNASSGGISLDVGSKTGSGTAGSITIGTGTNAPAAITISKTGGATTNINGNITFGASAGSGTIFTNNGATLNSAYAMANLVTGGWDAGGAAATVDKYTYITANQTTASQALTIPAPTTTTAGRVIYLSNIGTTGFTFTNTYLTATLSPGATATLVWTAVNGVNNWTYAGSDGGGILNQTTQQTSANFNISGTGKAANFDATTGTLGIGNSVATGITVGNTTNTTSILLQGAAGATYTVGTAANTGGIVIGNSTVGNTIGIATGANTTGTQTINIATATGNGGTAAINIGTSATAGSTSNITVGSTVAGTTTLQSAGGTAVNYAGTSNALTVANTGNGTNLNLTSTAATSATLLNISQNTAAYTGTAIKVNIANGSGSFASGKFIDFQTNGTTKFSVDANGNVAIGGTTAGTGSLTNNGYTVNTPFSISSTTGVFGANTATVDLYTYFAVTSAAGTNQVFTVPTPTANTTYGRTIYITNVGANTFTFGNTYLTASLKQGATASLIWANVGAGAGWTYAGSDAGGIFNQSTQQTGANFNIDGTGKAAGFDATTGGLAIGGTTATSITEGNTTNTASWLVQGTTAATYTIGTSTNTGGITIGNSTAAAGSTVGISTGANTSGTQTVNIATATGNGGTAAINIGTSATAGSTSNITVGSTIAGSTTFQSAGGSAFNYAGTSNAVTVANTGNGTNLNLTSTAATSASLVNITQNTAAYTGTAIKVNIANGSGSFASGKFIDFQTNSTSKFMVDAAGNVQVAPSATVDTNAAGSLGFGTTNATSITIGRTSGAVTQTINIGSNATASSTTNIVIGSTVAGTTTLQSAGGVIINTPTFATAATQTCGTSCTVTQGNVDTTGAVVVNATAGSLIVSLPDPTITTAGRIVYVTAANGSNDFTLRVNGGGTGNDIAMRANTTATMIWNGSDWTAAGASSSTTLQAAYDNTLTSAGGAELVLSSTANHNGLTIRDSSSSPVGSTLLEVQNSSAASVLSVNANVTDYANNGGAESTFASDWSSFGTSTITRNTSATYVATGTGSVSVAATAATSGVKNTLTTTLTSNQHYNVSFAAKLDNGASGAFTDLNVYYSKTGSATDTACTNYSIQTIPRSVWVKVNCTITVPASGATGTNAIAIIQAASATRTWYVDNLSVTIAADLNYATDGGVDDNTNFATNWTSAGLGTVAVSRSTTDGYDTSDSAIANVTTGAANAGIRNKLSINPLASASGVLYRMSVYTKLNSGAAFSDFKIRYSPDGGTTFKDCTDYNTQSIPTSVWTQVTCYVTTDNTTVTSPYAYFVETTSGVRSFSVDAFSMTLASNNTPNVQIGGGITGGPTTLLTLDRAASAPIAANNDALLGSMYYDTTQGKIQCYQASGWGSCGAASDNIVTLSPEFTNAVFHGPSGGTAGVGVMSSDFCSGTSALSINTSICAATETYNFYQWTSPQTTTQTYAIYVTYQLPSTFKSFTSGSTSVMGRTDSGASGGAATVNYKVYKSNGSGLTSCGTVSVASGTSASWQPGTATGTADPSTCGFSAGDKILFEIDVAANKDAKAYVGNLGFSFTNK